MNFTAGLVVLAFLCASCLVKESEGIKCYVCDACNDPFDSGNVITIDCAGSCVKLKSSAGVQRSCISDIVVTACVKTTTHGISGEGCLCDSDYCNSSSIPKVSISVAVTMFVWTYMLKFAL